MTRIQSERDIRCKLESLRTVRELELRVSSNNDRSKFRNTEKQTTDWMILIRGTETGTQESGNGSTEDSSLKMLTQYLYRCMRRLESDQGEPDDLLQVKESYKMSLHQRRDERLKIAFGKKILIKHGVDLKT